MNAGQMFMSMMQGVAQPVIPETPLSALPLAGEHKKTGAAFADLLSEIRMQANAKSLTGDDIGGVTALSNETELPSDCSVSNNSSEISEFPGTETDRNPDASGIQDELAKPGFSAFDVRSEDAFPGGIPINLEVYTTEAQAILAAYAQSGRMPVVNSPPSHEVDCLQNVPIAAEPGQKYFATETPVKVRFAEELQPSQQLSAEQNAGPVTSGHQTGRVETTPISTPDKPVLQTAEQSYRFATAEPEHRLPQQPKVSEATTQIATKTVTPEFVQPKTAAAPVMEVAAKPEATQQAERIPSTNRAHLEAPVLNLTAPRQQPGRMPLVNSPPSHEADSTKNAVATTVAAELPHFVSTAQVAAQPVSEQAVPPVPANQQTGRVETTSVKEAAKPVLQNAEQSYRFATVEPEYRLPQQPKESATATPATPATTSLTQITAKTVAEPAMEVAAKSEATQQTELIPSVNRTHLEAPVQNLTAPRQQSGGMPVVNSPSSHEVDFTRNTVATTAAAKVPHVLSAEQVAAQPVSEQAERPASVNNHQTGRVETASVIDAAKPSIQTADQTESLSALLPGLQLSRRSATASSESEAEIAFTLPRPIAVSRTHSTESSRMQQTTAILRPQIISLDMDQPQKSPAESGTVSTTKLETSSPPTAQRRENGRTPEAILPLRPEIGLTQKVRSEVAMSETATDTSVKPSEEKNLLKATSDINSAPMQQTIRRTVQANPDANFENTKPSSSQAVARENAISQQNTVPAGEAVLTSDDSTSNSRDQAWSGQRSDNQMVTDQIHAQSKPEHQTVGTVPNARINAEQTRQDLPEQIAHQVRERLTRHEVKPGNQQITLTLSPENMGELKMNLNLQGQRLSVEILTENRTVRDAILQHSDSLKDSLARQNITVESFDVTTNGRSSGNHGHNQEAWRELAKQKQQQFWTSTGGYRLPQMDTSPNTLAYQAQKEHAMLDIHY